MDFDLHINEAIQVIDLIKLIKWSSLPIFFSIIIPVFYSTFYKLNPKDESSLNSSSSSLDKVISFFSLPSLDRFIINTSVLFHFPNWWLVSKEIRWRLAKVTVGMLRDFSLVGREKWPGDFGELSIFICCVW